MIDLIKQIVYLIASYVFFYELLQLLCQCRQKNKVLLHRGDYKYAGMHVVLISSGLITVVLILIDRNNDVQHLAIFLFYIINYLICFPDRNNVLESCKLNIGYGAALWYYKNYLKKRVSDSFLERVKIFESFNKVRVEKKLFILIPESCIVKSYLDDETDCIERCRELPKSEQTNSGFKGRVYNITVYLVKTSSGKKRMAIEYAQPLKGLLAFKEKTFFTKEEMLYQRKLFVESLCEFLKDDKDLYDICEIVEYNDNEKKVSDVLMYICNLEKSVCEIV